MASPLHLNLKMRGTGRAAVFLDRDGVINENRPDYVKSWAEFTFLPGVFASLRRLAQTELAIVVVSNQSAVNRGLVSETTLEEIHTRMASEITRHGGRIDAIFYCPHRPDENCPCRKPQPGLLLRAAKELDLNLTASYLIGDAISDVEAGLAVGCTTFLVLTGRGRAELARLEARGFKGFHVAADLGGAVDRILGGVGESPCAHGKR